MFEGFDTRFRSFSQGFYRTVGAIAYIADDLVPGGGPLGEKAIAHSLHFATYYKLARNLVWHISRKDHLALVSLRA